MNTTLIAAMLLGMCAAAMPAMASGVPPSHPPAGAATPATARQAAQLYEQAVRLDEGHGQSMDRGAARALFLESARLGDPRAAYRAARHLAGLSGGRQDAAAAAALMTQAAQGGHAQAQYELGMLHHNGSAQLAKDAHRAAHWLVKAAAQGSIPAQCILAGYHRDGLGGLPVRPSRAAALYRHAAVSSDRCAPAAQYELAKLYRSGLGVQQDRKQALRWLSASADSGNPDAQRALAEAYRLGDGVPRDAELAKWWLKKSREGVSAHDDHDHFLPSFAGPRFQQQFGLIN